MIQSFRAFLCNLKTPNTKYLNIWSSKSWQSCRFQCKKFFSSPRHYQLNREKWYKMKNFQVLFQAGTYLSFLLYVLKLIMSWWFSKYKSFKQQVQTNNHALFFFFFSFHITHIFLIIVFVVYTRNFFENFKA